MEKRAYSLYPSIQSLASFLFLGSFSESVVLRDIKRIISEISLEITGHSETTIIDSLFFSYNCYLRDPVAALGLSVSYLHL